MFYIVSSAERRCKITIKSSSKKAFRGCFYPLLERSNRVGMFLLESNKSAILRPCYLYPILGLKMALSSVAAFCIRWCFAPLPLHL